MYEILKKKYKLGYVRKDQLQRYAATCQADDSGDGDSTVPGCMEQLPGSSGIYLQLEEMDDSSGFEPVCRYRGNTV